MIKGQAGVSSQGARWTVRMAAARVGAPCWRNAVLDQGGGVGPEVTVVAGERGVDVLHRLGERGAGDTWGIGGEVKVGQGGGVVRGR